LVMVERLETARCRRAVIPVRVQERAAGMACQLGGASPGKQALAAGVCDEIVVHIAPYLMGGGVRLFDEIADGGTRLEKLSVSDGPLATHIRYRVLKR
jgi:dihydrofolate reductase